jgi:hypothetical protein
VGFDLLNFLCAELAGHIPGQQRLRLPMIVAQ